MMRKYLRVILCFFCILVRSIQAQSPHSIIVDKNLSPFAGRELIISLNSGWYQIESKVLKPRYNSESGILSKTGGLFYRFSKYLLLDYPVVHLSWIIQHEYFGHGYKARELGVSDISYKLTPPFPYGEGNGSTRLSQDFFELFPHEKSAVFYSGSQAASMIAQSLRLRFIENRSVNYQEALLYLSTFSDLNLYILTTDYNTAKGGNDITNYIQVTYPGSSAEAKLKKLKERVLVNFLSPFPYISLYMWIKTYLWSGNVQNSLPVISFSKLNYLPSFRFGLSPHGYEIYWENYIRTAERTINLYWRQGESGINENWGSGLYISNLFKSQLLSFDGNVHFWKQPPVFTDQADSSSKEACFGTSLSLTTTISPFKNEKINFIFQIGYKSKGFLEGENLSEDMILRAGLLF